MRRIFKPSKREIFPLLKAHVSTSCVVVHDGLAAYNDLPKDMGKCLIRELMFITNKVIYIGYKGHKEVNHSKTLIDYSDGTNTNGIEGAWGRIKVSININIPHYFLPIHMNTYFLSNSSLSVMAERLKDLWWQQFTTSSSAARTNQRMATFGGQLERTTRTMR